MTNYLAIKKEIEKELKIIKNQQINLASAQARETLSESIAKKLVSKFYLVSYSSQESFE